jgi:hypothetical protein
MKYVLAPITFLLAGALWLLSKAINAWPERWQ